MKENKTKKKNRSKFQQFDHMKINADKLHIHRSDEEQKCIYVYTGVRSNVNCSVPRRRRTISKLTEKPYKEQRLVALYPSPSHEGNATQLRWRDISTSKLKKYLYYIYSFKQIPPGLSSWLYTSTTKSTSSLSCSLQEAGKLDSVTTTSNQNLVPQTLITYLHKKE